MPALLFDSVRVTDGGRVSHLTVDEFLALPIHKRVQLVLARQVAFLRGATDVPRSLALRSLREWELLERGASEVSGHEPP